MVTETMPDGEQDPEIVRLREWHLGISREEETELERALARDMLGSMFGEEALAGYESDDLEEMIAHAAARHAER